MQVNLTTSNPKTIRCNDEMKYQILTSVSIPDSVTSIGNEAFINDTSTSNFKIAYSSGKAGTYTYNEADGTWTKQDENKTK